MAMFNSYVSLPEGNLYTILYKSKICMTRRSAEVDVTERGFSIQQTRTTIGTGDTLGPFSREWYLKFIPNSWSSVHLSLSPDVCPENKRF